MKLLVSIGIVLALGACDKTPGPDKTPAKTGRKNSETSKALRTTGVGEVPVSEAKRHASSPLGNSSGDQAHRLMRERVAGFALISLPVSGFEQMSLREKLLTYHLYQASVAGRDIAYDQNHRLSLQLRNAVSQVVTHGKGLESSLLDRIRTYQWLMWISNGPFHERTKRKIAPTFSAEEWEVAVSHARTRGAKIVIAPELAMLMFDESYDPMLTSKLPPAGQDILTASANNLYDGVKLSELKGFTEQYPLNSRLVKREGRLIEEVYRAGRKSAEGKRPAPPGRYASSLKRVITHLRAALPYTEQAQKETLEYLIDYFETGEPAAFDRANIAWLRDNPSVDLILGFIETYKDARGVKGEWEGIVSIIDAEATRLMAEVANNAQHFEDNSPWADKYKKKGIKVPVAKAIQVIVAHGGSGPSLPSGVNLPNSQAIREQYGSKSFLLTNVMRAIDQAVSDEALDEFAMPSERESARKYGTLISNVTTALHEVIGHGSGKLSEKLMGKDPAFFLKEYTNSLEECRAELVALHHIWDPRMAQIESRCGEPCAEEALRSYVRHDLTMLRRVAGDRIEDDHMRATHAIVQYAAAAGAVVIETHNGKRFQILKDVTVMRAAVAELLAEVMRIKAEGDYVAAKKLFETYGMHFDKGLRDEVRLRAQRIGLPQFYAFIMPSLKLIEGDKGKPIDVVLEVQRDFSSQMRQWDKKD